MQLSEAGIGVTLAEAIGHQMSPIFLLFRSDDFSDDEFGPPAVEQPAQDQQQSQPQQQEQVAFIGGCTAVYDYVNETGDGLSMHQGDQFYVVAADSGDGWTLVSSLDSSHQGYVPSGYINVQYY